MIYSPLHPIRRFQLDPQLSNKLARFREEYAETLKAGRSGLAGPTVAITGGPMDLRDEAFENAGNFISASYKYFQAREEMLRFLLFWDGPRQIFSFDRGLASALAHTDCDDVPWELLTLPYDEFYIHFGTVLDTGLDILDRYYLPDGVYVRRQGGESVVPGFGGPDTLHITLTTALASHTYDEILADNPPGMRFGEPIYKFVMCGKPGQTVREALEQGNEANVAFARQRDDLLFESSMNYAREAGMSMDGAKRIPAYEGYFERGRDLMDASLSLLINCIAYLTHVEIPERAEYPPDTPRKLLDKMERAVGPRRREVLRKHLEDRGYTKVKFVRHEGFSEFDEEPVPTGKTVRPHWRRGHWRLQPCGPANSQIRLCWIKPTLVNADKGEPSAGHVYQVEDQ